MGPLGSTVPGQAQKGSPGLENYMLSRVGALPIGVSASQPDSYVKEGARKTSKMVPLLTMK